MEVMRESLSRLISKQVEENSLVIWYDPEEVYSAVLDSLSLPNAIVGRYDGSFLQLRREIDTLLNELHPPRLVVCVPMDQARTDHALIKLGAASVVMQPGQQPPNRNARLSFVAQNALGTILGDDNAAEGQRVANPDLNDGVVLNIAPLWELVPWKEAMSYWDDLIDGKYEWSSIGKQLREKSMVHGP
jgi:hypothetical protein